MKALRNCSLFYYHNIRFYVGLNECTSGEFMCRTRDGMTCLPNMYKCDTVQDCEDNVDEQDCPDQGSEGRCKIHHYFSLFFIIISKVVALNVYYLMWFSTQTLSSFYALHLSNITLIDDSGMCESNEYQCDDGSCINQNERCNGIPECSDESDEKNCDSCSGQSFQ